MQLIPLAFVNGGSEMELCGLRPVETESHDRSHNADNTKNAIVKRGKLESGNGEPDIQRVLNKLVPSSITSLCSTFDLELAFRIVSSNLFVRAVLNFLNLLTQPTSLGKTASDGKCNSSQPEALGGLVDFFGCLGRQSKELYRVEPDNHVQRKVSKVS